MTKGALIIGPTGSIGSSMVVVGTAGNLTVNGNLSGNPQLADSGTTVFNASQTLASLGGSACSGSAAARY